MAVIAYLLVALLSVRLAISHLCQRVSLYNGTVSTKVNIQLLCIDLMIFTLIYEEITRKYV